MAYSSTDDACDWYTVQPGDTLPDIAQHFWHDAQKYMLIFEANLDVLEHPDRLTPGQTLRIPYPPRKCVEPGFVRRRSSVVTPQKNEPQT